MRLLRKVAYKWANAITKTFNLTNKAKRIYYHWIKIIIRTIIKMGIVLSVAKLLDVFEPTLYCALIYAFFKVISGGMHYRYFGKSILLSLILFFTMGVLTDTFVLIYTPFNDQLTKGPLIHIGIMAVIAIVLTILYIPARLRHRVRHWNKLKYFYKTFTIIAILASAYISYILLINATTMQAIAMQLTIVMSLWTAILFHALSSIPMVYIAISMINQVFTYK